MNIDQNVFKNVENFMVLKVELQSEKFNTWMRRILRPNPQLWYYLRKGCTR